jgi:hypothetical protein
MRRQSNASAPPVISVREKRALNAVFANADSARGWGQAIDQVPDRRHEAKLPRGLGELTVSRHADERQIRKEREGHRAE